MADEQMADEQQVEWEVVDHPMGDDGHLSSIRQRWVGCEPPGPPGCGVRYVCTHEEWRRAEDGVWEHTVYAWEPYQADGRQR